MGKFGISRVDVKPVKHDRPIIRDVACRPVQMSRYRLIALICAGGNAKDNGPPGAVEAVAHLFYASLYFVQWLGIGAVIVFEVVHSPTGKGISVNLLKIL